MFESFTELVSGSPWTYAFIFAISAIDVLFPAVPSETSVILAGVLAGTGDLVLALVVACAAAGAILGDNTSYWIGRKAGPWIVRRFFGGKREQRVVWGKRQVEERGPYLIVVGRFIPGGRTVITLSAGLLQMRWPKFLSFDVAAGLVWASYAALLGYVGGRQFEEEPLKGFLIAFAIAIGVTAGVEVYRYARKRRVLARG